MPGHSTRLSTAIKFTVQQTDDVKTVKKLHKKLFPRADWDECEAYWLIYTEKGDVAGFASARKSFLHTKSPWAFFARGGVLEQYRGKGLQRRLIKARLAWAKKKGYAGVFTYVANRNSASLINLLKEGFHVTETGHYRGKKWIPDKQDGFTPLEYRF